MVLRTRTVYLAMGVANSQLGGTDREATLYHLDLCGGTFSTSAIS